MNPDAAAAILNVGRDADAASIRAAFELRSRMWHPDRFASGTQRERSQATIEFVRITTAFEVLSSAGLRSNNDVQTPQFRDTNVQPHEHVGSKTTPRGGFREYLGFGSSSTSFREFFGFGSTRK